MKTLEQRADMVRRGYRKVKSSCSLSLSHNFFSSTIDGIVIKLEIELKTNYFN